MRWLAAAYALGLYGFIYLPVVVLVLFSFHDGRFPIPPFEPATLRGRPVAVLYSLTVRFRLQ